MKYEPVVEVKPCPFCGKKPEIRWTLDKPVIECNNRKCAFQPSSFLRIETDSARKLVSMWNERK